MLFMLAVIIVVLVQALMAGVLADRKGYSGAAAFILAFLTAGLPVLVFYAGLPLTPKKELEKRAEVLRLAEANNAVFGPEDDKHIDVSRV